MIDAETKASMGPDVDNEHASQAAGERLLKAAEKQIIPDPAWALYERLKREQDEDYMRWVSVNRKERMKFPWLSTLLGGGAGAAIGAGLGSLLPQSGGGRRAMILAGIAPGAALGAIGGILKSERSANNGGEYKPMPPRLIEMMDRADDEFRQSLVEAGYEGRLHDGSGNYFLKRRESDNEWDFWDHEEGGRITRYGRLGPDVDMEEYEPLGKSQESKSAGERLLKAARQLTKQAWFNDIASLGGRFRVKIAPKTWIKRPLWSTRVHAANNPYLLLGAPGAILGAGLGAGATALSTSRKDRMTWLRNILAGATIGGTSGIIAGALNRNIRDAARALVAIPKYRHLAIPGILSGHHKYRLSSNVKGSAPTEYVSEDDFTREMIDALSGAEIRTNYWSQPFNLGLEGKR